jgi:hypothetical protein
MQFPAVCPEIPVLSLTAALAYYRDQLGFTVDWSDEQLGLAGLSRGDTRMFVSTAEYRSVLFAVEIVARSAHLHTASIFRRSVGAVRKCGTWQAPLGARRTRPKDNVSMGPGVGTREILFSIPRGVAMNRKIRRTNY